MWAFVPALMLGLGGSLHCVGMCGPLMMGISYPGRSRWDDFGLQMIYQFGRIGSYALLGLILGTIGLGVLWMEMQRYLVLLIGVLMIIWGVGHWYRMPILRNFESMMDRLVQKYYAKGFRQRGKKAYFYLGLMNGLIPCGLVYAALGMSLATGHPIMGVGIMIAFGLGTLPLLLAAILGIHRFVPNFRTLLTSWRPFILILIGSWLVFRSLGLVIPEEFTFWEAVRFPVMCH